MTRNLNIDKLFLKGIITILLLQAVFPVMAQTDNAGYIRKQFDKYEEQYLREKIFIHTDRSFYIAGEIIWFKVYCTDEDNKLLNLSKVAYVEVLNKDLEPVIQAKIALTDGTGSGSLALPSNIYSGNYIFRAYTNWMKNFEPELYFHQNITIINTIQSDTLPVAEVQDNYDVQFFPEGGYLVNGLQTKVAFRVTDQTGKGINFKAWIAGENNDTLLRFSPSSFGIGNFTFTPQNNQQYKAFITTPNGKTITKSLPAALNKGYVMNVMDSEKEGRLKINIQTNTDSKSAYLFIHAREQVKIAQLLNFRNGNAEFEIDKINLGEGISHLTLFDINNEPVCERLYFKRPSQHLIINASMEAADVLLRKKVTVDLMTKDESGTPQAADMSMAVFLIDSLPFSYKDIYSYLWLSSELKGKIESPEYYLNNNMLRANEALDNLMLTQGWRKFKWDDVLKNNKPPLTFLPEYEGHIISGKIINKATETPATNMQAFLSVPGTHFQLYNSISNNTGSVNFNTKDFYGTRLMVALVNAADTASYRIDFLNPFSESFSTEKISSFNAVKAEPLNLLKRSINMQVQNIFASAGLNTFETPKADTANFYGKATKSYLLDNYTRFPTMEEVLTEYVQEINIRKRQDQFALTMFNRDENGNTIIKEPVILLDGIPQFDLGNKISHYDPLKVKRLEIINHTYVLGTATFDGIASFFTYKGDLEGFQLDPSSTVLDYEALQLRREFYAPVYETTEQYNSRLPDNRTLIYWSPHIKTDDKGSKQINFYTSDLPGKYAVVLQGISKGGYAGSEILMIDVKKDSSVTK